MELRELFEQGIKKAEAGKELMLLRIEKAEGSTPRKENAVLLLCEDGESFGTVGGGLVEYLAVKDGMRYLQDGTQSAKKAYNLSRDAIDGIDMVCGGDVEISFQALRSGECKPESLSCLREQLKRAQEIQNRLIIFGAGHVARAVVAAMRLLDFDCVVYDDRPGLAKKEFFGGEAKVLCGNYADALSAVEVRSTDYVLIMTEGHHHDYALQKQLLRTEACYIGVIGSRAKTEANNKRLRADGFSEEEIGRFYGPVGLQIGAETPEEIAVSIAAEIILKRAVLEGREKALREGSVRLCHM